jgi:uncharacterized coiled-coil protein SlyX
MGMNDELLLLLHFFAKDRKWRKKMETRMDKLEAALADATAKLDAAITAETDLEGRVSTISTSLDAQTHLVEQLQAEFGKIDADTSVVEKLAESLGGLTDKMKLVAAPKE